MKTSKVVRVVIVGFMLSKVPGLFASNSAVEPKQPNAMQGDKVQGRKFQEDEIRIILGYFRNTGDLPPGLAKRDTLPPGLEKQLRERGTLPPGLQKRLLPLPADLEIRLPKLPKGLIRVVIGVDVVLMDSVGDMILDVIEDVFR